MILSLRTWKDYDYDLSTFIWDCPLCHVRVGIGISLFYKYDKIQCHICKTELDILEIVAVERDENLDPKYHDPYMIKASISKSYTKEELLREVDLVLEGFKDRLRILGHEITKTATNIPDVTGMDMNNAEVLVENMEKAGRGYMSEVQKLKQELTALKRYQKAPIK